MSYFINSQPWILFTMIATVLSFIAAIDHFVRTSGGRNPLIAIANPLAKVAVIPYLVQQIIFTSRHLLSKTYISEGKTFVVALLTELAIVFGFIVAAYLAWRWIEWLDESSKYYDDFSSFLKKVIIIVFAFLICPVGWLILFGIN